jgi:hypothetical protein
MGWTSEESCFDSRHGQAICHFSKASGLASLRCCSLGAKGFLRGRNGWGLMLITYVTGLRKSRAIPHSPTHLPITHRYNVTFTLFRYLCPGIAGCPDWRLFHFSSNVTEYEQYLKMGHHGFLLNSSATITCCFLCLRTHIHTRPRHSAVKLSILVVTWRKGPVFWLL